MEFTVYKKDGIDSGEKLQLKQPAFDIEPNDHAIYTVVRAEQTNARRGTHSAKTRAEARGGGRKPWPQKGRGTARAGTIRSPLWVGGGRAFGPQSHKHHLKVNKKVKQLARKSVLAYRYKEDAIRVIKDFNFKAAKSRNIRQLLQGLEAAHKQVAILVGEITEKLYLAVRNFSNIKLYHAEEVSTYRLMDCDLLIFDKEGIQKLNNRLQAK